MSKLIMNNIPTTLEQHREEFSQRRFLAMPLAGAACWTLAGLINLFIPTHTAAWVLFIATGSIVCVGMLLSRITGEDFFRKSKPKNPFDVLFMRCMIMALLVYSIGIPFFMVAPSSLPLSLGILTGLMWLPFSWIIQHWAGTFHVIARTLFVVAAWYIFPQQSFIIVPVVVVIIYAFTICALEYRWRKIITTQNTKTTD